MRTVLADWLGDTNIWLRASEPAHPLYRPATQSVTTLIGRGEEVSLVPQVVMEYWRVGTATASQRGGFGWSPARADVEVHQLEDAFTLKPDTPEVYRRWRTLVLAFGVSGAAVYDARLVASMLTHRITHILTFNGDDFRRYSALGIVAVHPGAVSA